MTIENGGPTIDTSREAVERVLDGVTPERIWFGCQHLDHMEDANCNILLDCWSVTADPEPNGEWREGPHEYVRQDLYAALLARAEGAEARARDLDAACRRHKNEADQQRQARKKAAARAEAAEARADALVKERDEDAKDYCALMDRHDALIRRVEAAEAALAAMTAERDCYAGLRDAAEAALAATTKERDAERETVARLEAAIWTKVGECLAGLPHSEASQEARARIKLAINAALTQKDAADE